MKTILKAAVLTLIATVTLTNFAVANSEVYDKVIASTGLILVPQGNGKDMQGTCWVVDHQRKLVITNHHVVTDKKTVDVFFPMFQDGDVIPLRDLHLQKSPRFVGEVIHRDIDRDLALVRLEKLPTNAKTINLAAKSARPGQTVHSVGNSGYNAGVLWRYTRGQVRIVAPFTIKLETSTVKAKIVETESAINRGDSGGPLVNDNGDLVGVVSSFQPQDRLVSWNIDVNEVRTFLANANRDETASQNRPQTTGPIESGSVR